VISIKFARRADH